MELDKFLELTEVLRGGRQCDDDGVEIIMSRQACYEAADELESLRSENEMLRRVNTDLGVEVEKIEAATYEECAKLCEDGAGFDSDHPHDVFAKAIRAAARLNHVEDSDGPDRPQMECPTCQQSDCLGC